MSESSTKDKVEKAGNVLKVAGTVLGLLGSAILIVLSGGKKD